MYQTFAESANARGLLENTSELHICLEDLVASFCTPNQLRTTFIAIMNEGAPAQELYPLHLEYMKKDFIYHQDDKR